MGSPQLYVFASRSVKQLANPRMMAEMINWGEIFVSQIGIPLRKSYASRRNADKALRQLPVPSITSRFEERFPLDFEKYLETLRFSSWPRYDQYTDACESPSFVSSVEKKSGLSDINGGMKLPAPPTVTTKPFVDLCTPVSSPIASKAELPISTAPAPAQECFLGAAESMVHSRPDTPADQGLKPAPRRGLGILARKEAAQRKKAQQQAESAENTAESVNRDGNRAPVPDDETLHGRTDSITSLFDGVGPVERGSVGVILAGDSDSDQSR